MTERKSVLPEDQLTEEQKVNARQGKCPRCDGTMVHLKPPQFPNKAEMYCEPCHFSFPLFKR